MTGPDDTLADIEEALAWEEQWERDAMRWSPEFTMAPQSPQWAEYLGITLVPSQVRLLGVIQSGGTFRPLMLAVGRAFAKIADSLHPLMVVLGRGDHRRCPRCHPMANPRPLCIDGAAYHRRRKARTRRRNR